MLPFLNRFLGNLENLPGTQRLLAFILVVTVATILMVFFAGGLKTGVPVGPYAELLSEIPPVGRRRIRARAGKIALDSALISICATALLAELVIWGWNSSEAIPVWVRVVGVVGAAILPSWFGQRLAREHRILKVGTAVEAQITAVVVSMPETSFPGSISYLYKDPSGQVGGGTMDYDGEEQGDLALVFVEADNPQRHVLLPRSYYRILKDPAN